MMEPTDLVDRDPLESLLVIDRLVVGPVKLEKNKLTATYTVTQQGVEDSQELSYRYEEDVFDPTSEDDLNLASLIAAQVALNYGLFCNEIVFHGPLDRADRRFLADAAVNTAREIYVKKFLEPNAYLVGEAARLPPIKRPTYLRAQLRFPDALKPNSRAYRADKPQTKWQVDRRRAAVLSSGGKDSLLSYGLLNEIGIETHSIFLNESGRHWYTALNAHRHFAAKVPHTARVWTSSDRLFAWMVRHLPFVRQDFASVRSDEYPVRLWTVAVFLFGALPLMKKRGVARLIIGDEYDTTRRASFKGITHYDGLYDQSRYFDNALTRFFQRKGWGLSQFSLLRPLSEFSIQRLLARRYPELQALQVSCHAAHLEGERVRPCGKCEKCRRIVGMLAAVDEDPGRCGYSPAQVDLCLKALAGGEMHQEAEGAQHLAFLLKQKNLITEGSIGTQRARERPEVTRLRFDPERAPFDWIPRDLRDALLPIYLEHVDGAVRREGRQWLEFNPRTDPAVLQPYPFEGPVASTQAEPSTVESRRGYLLAEWTWPDARQRLRDIDVGLLPVGAIEQHGPHLPLDTDAFDADYLARQVAEHCSPPQPVVLPLIPYGVSYHHDDFPGTLSIAPETLAQLVYEVGMAAARNNITKLVIINGHGGNGPALHFAAQKINRDAHIFTAVDTGESSDADIEALAETLNDVHAGEIETATTLAIRPDLVQMDRAQRCVPQFSSRYLNFSSRRGVGWYARTKKLSNSGVLGDPTVATAEKGQKMWDVMIQNLVEFVEDIKLMSLDELYARRY